VGQNGEGDNSSLQKTLQKMRIAFVYDRVNKFGGAERVLMSLHGIFPEAPIYTLVHNPDKSSWANGIQVIPTFLNKISFLRGKHELLSPIAPMAFETHDFSGYDVILSITSGDAKSIITKPNQLHVCYCLTPTRYFWSGEGEYKNDLKMKLIPNFLLKYFRTIDLLTSKRPDKYIAISNEVKSRIKKYYNADSSIIYPSIDDKFLTVKSIKKSKKNYYLVVSRLVPYKKVDLVVKAFNKNKKRLVIAGVGSEYDRLKKLAKGNISFVGHVNDEKLKLLYKQAKAVIFPQEEDFGLVPLESQACGTPVIAYAKGGALETIIAGKTGLFFKYQTVKSLNNALRRFQKSKFLEVDCVANAKMFSNISFQTQIRKEITRLWQEFNS